MCCHCVNRREFLTAGAVLAAGAVIAPHLAGAATVSWTEDRWDPDRPFVQFGKPLRVQPVLMYRLPQQRDMASWKSWGGVQTAEAAKEEAARITGELADLAARAEFALEILPVIHIQNEEEAAAAAKADADVTVLYPATGSGGMLNAAIPDRGGIVFVRHRSGPVYYWYEALSTRYLRTDGETDPAKKLSVHDVVVDDYDEMLWRLRALFGVKNFMGSRVVALGGARGKYAENAPDFARDTYNLDIVEYPYEDLEKRIKSAFADTACMALADKWTTRYLELPGTTLATDRNFVVNAFVLYGIFRDIMEEHGTGCFTINQCMGTIIPMSKTTACLTLQLLNDEGYAVFCESDFVVVPAGMFLRQVSGKPVFMHNSTFPHNGCVTCAHCTGPRRMNADRYEPALITTHYESEYGAAPKVEIPVGQTVSFINPQYATGRWVGLRGTVEDNPFLEICRSQQDVRIDGDWKRLLNEVRDSHWLMVYEDYLREIGYAAPHIGIMWDNISA
jgi:L-fucose isomerase-like protein